MASEPTKTDTSKFLIAPEYPDYKDLVSTADWNKYFKDRSFNYSDPLQVALLRKLEDIQDMLVEHWG